MTVEEELAIADRHQKARYDKEQAIQDAKAETRKKLEWEAKLYQDGQNEKKKELVRQRTIEKEIHSAEIAQKVIEYEKKEEETKLQKLAKNKKHLQEMREQGSLPVAGVYAKTGVGIIKSP